MTVISTYNYILVWHSWEDFGISFFFPSVVRVMNYTFIWVQCLNPCVFLTMVVP